MADWIHSWLNIAFPLIIIFLHLLILPIYIPFKLLTSLKRSITSQENVARKVVLITGAAQGIGQQLAYEYARRGAFLALVDIKDNLEEVLRTAGKLGSPDVISIVADVSKVEDCKRFIDEAVRHFGRLDHLVNNAGTVVLSNFEDINQISDHQSVMDVNFWGTVNSIHFGIPHLKRTKGKIVVISSICGRYPVPLVSIYNASKAALISFCESLRIELGSTIGITVVTPGLIRTKMTREQDLKLRSIMPEESAEGCAKAIVRSVCRGESYLMEPRWFWWLFPAKMMFPELLDCCTRFLIKSIHQNSSKKMN
ncbi:11-beta-hydroxysteroid dehydrogenase-like 3 [Humulus lupulus]|uniref:11-beta-hydroxysteroid dehydrogenase-like 3 n=1 Tax=Humulus lupulus TaxID=3486 RepID=UPI002B4064B9|nr:11-beta-hydroxysteroid dehydrogenase-like 3 [Humulus lupulus]